MATPKRRKPAAKPPKPSPPERAALAGEAKCLLAVAGSLLTLICLFAAGETGFFGGVLNGLLKGLFGLGAYFAPFAVSVASVVTMYRKRRLALRDWLMWAGLFLVVVTLAHLAGWRGEPAEGVRAYIAARYKTGAANNGGLLGALLSDGLTALIGRVGAFILLIAGGLALLILITNRSLFAAVERGAKAVETRVSRYRDVYEEAGEPTSAKAQAPKPEPPPRRRREAPPEISQEDGGGDEPPISMIPRRKSATPHRAARDVRPYSRGGKVLTLELSPEPPEPDEPEPDEYEYEQADTEPAAAFPTPNPIPFPTPNPDSPPWEDAADGISIRGAGVEGYRAAVVDADGEIVEGKPTPAPAHAEYVYPPIEILRENPYVPSVSSKAEILENSRKLEETLKSFGVEAKVVEVCKGPTVTRYEVAPGTGVKVSKISSLADDLALNLAAVGIRIEAPVPGKSVVGIEIPNKETQSVFLREVIGDDAFLAYPSKLAFAIGKDIAGNTVIADIAKMPHLLIAGATGAGKSVCINTLIASIVYKAAPDEVKLLMIDPKVVELSVYNNIPHLLIPVVTDPKKASGALAWAVREMELRYNMFAEAFVRDLRGFNAVRAENGDDPLPQIVIIIDELADLMMTCGKEVEESICRLAQKARAAGLHLIIATQRPSVDVITGLIKANIPSRLAFAVTSGTDSRTILDMVGAEKLLGKGDMLFSPVGLSKPQRIQGSFISDKEVENLVGFIRSDAPVEFDQEMIDKITTPTDSDDYTPEGGDDMAEDAIAFIVTRDKASVSMLQRKFRIGYNRAANLMAELEERGIVGPEDGSRPRKVLMTQYQWREYKERRDNIEY